MSGKTRSLPKVYAASLVALLLVGLLSGTVLAGKTFGEPIDPKKVKTVDLDALFKDPSQYYGKTIIVEGPIATVCQTSGCWLTLGDGANQLYVQFFDFTIRLNVKTNVRIQGELRKKNNAPYLVGQGLEVL